MKQADSSWNCPLSPGLDKSWTTFVSPAPRLRLNALDFSDLWDEEDLGLESADEDGGFTAKATSQKNDNISCPPPPIAPPLPPPTSAASLRPGKGQTLKLHWRALQTLPLLPKVSRFGPQTIWAGLEPVHLDTNKLEHLFQSRTNSALCGMVGAQQKQQCISLLGVKRSNIISIALSSLPPPRLLLPAIISMDCCVMDRDDLQKLQALVPSEEELRLIREVQEESPRSPLGPAEDCLLTLGAVPHLSQRLRLWTFALDYDSLEREIAEPLFHLKLAMEQLAASHTFRCLLATVLAIGNFLNGCKARGFELSYLGKLSQVKDTRSHRPLLHHVCMALLELYPESSDLYSDVTAVTRVSKCDYAQVQASLAQLESCCKASWEQLRLLEKDKEREPRGTDTEGSVRRRLPVFLRECEERLTVLRAIHRRVINRFHSFLLFLGYPRVTVKGTSPEAFCKTLSNFALEYRTTRQAILQWRERDSKRKGKEAASDQQGIQSQECQEHSRLQEVLRTPESVPRCDTAIPRPRSKRAVPTGLSSSQLK